MPDGMIEYRRHDVAYFAPSPWSKGKSVQPQFHVHGADILQIHRSPFRNDVIRKIESVGLDGGVGFFLFGQLVFAVVGNEFRDGFRHKRTDATGREQRARPFGDRLSHGHVGDVQGVDAGAALQFGLSRARRPQDA